MGADGAGYRGYMGILKALSSARVHRESAQQTRRESTSVKPSVAPWSSSSACRGATYAGHVCTSSLFLPEMLLPCPPC